MSALVGWTSNNWIAMHRMKNVKFVETHFLHALFTYNWLAFSPWNANGNIKENTIVLNTHPHTDTVGDVHKAVRIPWLKWTQPRHRQTEWNCGPGMYSALEDIGALRKNPCWNTKTTSVYVCCSTSFTASKKRNANRNHNLKHIGQYLPIYQLVIITLFHTWGCEFHFLQ